MSHLARWQNLVLPVGIVVCLLVLIVPLPAGLLDLLLAANIAVAVIILLTTLAVKTPLEFSVFPSLLLVTTLSRLVLNVASTRLILTAAPTDRLDAAGQVIRAFGEFVAGNHTVVGLVIFSILVVIQFVVITKGAGRISEVAARFTLDGMPGRQMAIDADLNAGLIDNQQAQRRRQEIVEQADFYGAMDGASKFVRGDAVAGMVITFINILGGLFVGVIQGGLTLAEAGELFTKLTIGDGLVAQIPALLISVAAGLLVTRSSQSVDLPHEFLRQLFSRPQVLAVAAGFLGLLVFTRLPALPLLTIGAGCAGLAYLLSRPAETPLAPEKVEPTADEPPKTAEKRIEDYLAVDALELEIGVGLIRLADPKRGGDLLNQITGVRRLLAAELGVVLPKVRIRDNLRLDRRKYRIKVAGNPVAEGSVCPDKLLILTADGEASEFAGEPASDPAGGRLGCWIEPDQLDQAQQQRATILEPTAAIAQHLGEIVRQHAAELLTRELVKHLIDELRKTSPAVVEELIPGVMRLGEVQQVLQRLLREEVPIRPLETILEALGDHAVHSRDPVLLTELVRRRLARTLSAKYRDAQRRLRAVVLDPPLEDRVLAGIQHHERGLAIRLSSQTVQSLCERIGREVAGLQRGGYPPVVLVSPEVRAGLKQMTAARLPHLAVLSYDEITPDTMVEPVHMVREPMPIAA
ncbi:MAG TPA: flagellar biosynthesis protein FlhA [Candidatus Anammoximicrobium sp.]|nr:flagellar biosynthesis protein FlhA [Candidatus Anammoximicrobium sp.]